MKMKKKKKKICKQITKHDTFPMVFHNGKLLGGLDKMMKLLNT